MTEHDVVILNRVAAVVVSLAMMWLWPHAMRSARNLYSMIRHNKPIKEKSDIS
ncbi:MAG TPA: hypothetical protein VF438_01230 [Candidatus Paceibacterota bacterium]